MDKTSVTISKSVRDKLKAEAKKRRMVMQGALETLIEIGLKQKILDRSTHSMGG